MNNGAFLTGQAGRERIGYIEDCPKLCGPVSPWPPRALGPTPLSHKIFTSLALVASSSLSFYYGFRSELRCSFSI